MSQDDKAYMPLQVESWEWIVAWLPGWAQAGGWWGIGMWPVLASDFSFILGSTFSRFVAQGTVLNFDTVSTHGYHSDALGRHNRIDVVEFRETSAMLGLAADTIICGRHVLTRVRSGDLKANSGIECLEPEPTTPTLLNQSSTHARYHPPANMEILAYDPSIS